MMMMSSLSMVEAELPPGFRFHPRDEELVCDYLMNKVSCSAAVSADDHPPLLIEVDLNKCEPWDIPLIACVGGKEWYFYSQRDKKYATGQRKNRATMSGYWKATGKDRPILDKAGGTLVGMRKTLVFYQGRAPHGRKTQWVMHEFRLEGPLIDISNSPKEDWVLCRMFHKKKEIHGEADQAFNGCSDDSTLISSSSSSLPPLMEPFISTFDQTVDDHHHHHHLNDHDQYEHHHHQVPCFSIFNPNQTTHSHMHHMTTPNIFNHAPTYPISSSCDDDTKELKAVLDHLTTNMETTNCSINPSIKQYSPPTSSGDGSSESFLSELGLSTMWNV